jgi:hypothetical protein
VADLVSVATWSAALSLDDTLRRLRHSRRIVAIGFLGSTGTAEFSAASDYDLLLLAGDYPAGYGIEATIIDHRIADIVIVGADEAATEWNLGHHDRPRVDRGSMAGAGTTGPRPRPGTAPRP